MEYGKRPDRHASLHRQTLGTVSKNRYYKLFLSLLPLPILPVFLELVVGNIIRRVLRIIRDEYKSIPEEGTTDVESEGGDYDEQDISNGIFVHLSLWTLTVMLACLLAARMDAEQDEA